MQVIGNRPRLGPRRDEAVGRARGGDRRTGLALGDDDRRARADRSWRGHRGDRHRAGPLMSAAVVVLAAGAGTRVGAEVEQGAAPAGRRPGRRPLGADRPGGARCRRVVLVVREGEQEAVRAAVEPHLDDDGPEVAMVTGGATRHASEWAALALLAPAIEAGEIDVVAMHDAARPLVAVDALRAPSWRAAATHGGAIPAAPLHHLVDRRRRRAAGPAGRRADAAGVPRGRPAGRPPRGGSRRLRGDRHRRLPGGLRRRRGRRGRVRRRQPQAHRRRRLRGRGGAQRG